MHIQVIGIHDRAKAEQCGLALGNLILGMDGKVGPSRNRRPQPSIIGYI